MGNSKKEIQSFCLGYVFDRNLTRVFMGPRTQGAAPDIGKLDGIFGKIQPGESAHDAMIREVQVQMGVVTDENSWRAFNVIRYQRFWGDPDTHAICYVFRTQINPDLQQADENYVKLTVDGVNKWHPLEPLVGWHQYSTEQNKFLLPMAAYCGSCPTVLDYQDY